MTQTLSFAINGLSCGACAARAERALSAVEGLSDVHVNFASHQARVTLAHGADLDPALTALEQAGYPARIIQESFDIANLSCGGCVARAERAIGALGGVTDVTVNLATHQGQISYIEGLTSADEIRDLSHAAGYGATRRTANALAHAPHDPEADDRAELARALFWATVLTVPVFILEMGSHLFPPFTCGYTRRWVRTCHGWCNGR